MESEIKQSSIELGGHEIEHPARKIDSFLVIIEEATAARVM